MKRLLLILVVVLSAAGCTTEDNEGGTPIPGQQSGAPLYDDAIGPSEEQQELDQ
jgi:hypothetical protein